MYPVNQVILGGESMLTNFDDIDLQIQKMEENIQEKNTALIKLKRYI